MFDESAGAAVLPAVYRMLSHLKRVEYIDVLVVKTLLGNEKRE